MPLRKLLWNTVIIIYLVFLMMFIADGNIGILAIFGFENLIPAPLWSILFASNMLSAFVCLICAVTTAAAVIYDLIKKHIFIKSDLFLFLLYAVYIILQYLYFYSKFSLMSDF